MKKATIIGVIGLLIIIFPLLALPTGVELWMHIVMGIFTIVFAFYEYVVVRDRGEELHPRHRMTSTRHTFGDNTVTPPSHTPPTNFDSL